MENTGKKKIFIKQFLTIRKNYGPICWKKTKQIHTFADETKKLVGEGTVAKVKKEKPLVMAEDTGLVAKTNSQGQSKFG